MCLRVQFSVERLVLENLMSAADRLELFPESMLVNALDNFVRKGETKAIEGACASFSLFRSDLLYAQAAVVKGSA
jgi:hypothetical protein